MADEKITDYSALTGTNLATGDLFEMVDVSDTSMDATGTNKKMTAAELAAGLAAQAIPVDTQSGTTYTLVLGDAGVVVRCTNASAVTVTIPPNSSVAFPTETLVHVYAAGAGGVTIAAGAGVTIRNNSPATLPQYAECSLRKDGTDEWVRVG